MVGGAGVQVPHRIIAVVVPIVELGEDLRLNNLERPALASGVRRGRDGALRIGIGGRVRRGRGRALRIGGQRRPRHQ
jgi:hypothetical protein